MALCHSDEVEIALEAEQSSVFIPLQNENRALLAPEGGFVAPSTLRFETNGQTFNTSNPKTRDVNRLDVMTTIRRQMDSTSE